ncbi:hypothetical protein [Nocardioides zeae]|uniref:Uncharacterized protein n=1 Tax=Nocardioides zeae TaxID=1457234 RepID=A0A6P0HKZ3_9ACTN|nr:hypothetical protein [Nocardioides zeae]NEN78960.1 hypothetical protein [Nocardioides zeae]
MTTHPDHVGTSQRVLDVWRAELAPVAREWSLLLSSPEIELGHGDLRPAPGAGAASPLLAAQAVDLGAASAAEEAPDLATVLDAAARAARPTSGSPDAALATLVALLGGAEAVNDRLRRGGHRTRFTADGGSVLVPGEQAETMAALTGNPAYEVALPAFLADAPSGLAAYLVADAVLWHAQGWTTATRQDGGVLALPDGGDLTVHVRATVAVPSPSGARPVLDDPVYAAFGRALGRTLPLLGHGDLRVAT